MFMLHIVVGDVQHFVTRW